MRRSEVYGKALTIIALLFLFVGRLICFLPYKGWRRLLSLRDAGAGVGRPSDLQVSRALHFGRLVERAAKKVPWRADCLPKVIACVLYLRMRRIPFLFFLGAKLDSGAGEKGLSAHAWIQVMGRNLFREESLPSYAVVARLS